MKDFITNEESRTLGEITGYTDQFKYIVYLAATHDFGTVNSETLRITKYLRSAQDIHRVQVKAAVIVRRNIREGHDWHNDQGHCKRWIRKYKSYMSARKFKSYKAYQELVDDIIANTGSYTGR